MEVAVFEQKYIRPVVAAATAYETVAITTRKVPTLSACIWWLYRKAWGRILLWGAWGWLTCHFFISELEQAIEEAASDL